METTAQRLQQIMAECNLRQVDIIEKSKKYQKELDIELKKSTLSQYISGKSVPAQKQLYLLSKTLEVSEAWLMGYETNKTKNSFNTTSSIISGDHNQITNSGTMTATGRDTYNFNENHDQTDHNATMQTLSTADLKLQRSLLNKLDKQTALLEENNILLTSLLELGGQILIELRKK